MKISKSKRQLAQLLIEAGVKKFPDGASWVAQDSDGGIRGHEGKPKWQIVNKYWWEGGEFWLLCRSDRFANFHQTILSRAEFDQIVAESAEQGKPEQTEPQYCESVTRAIPEPVTAPTLDRLLRDYRNASDFSAAKQAEADEAAKQRDERWKEVQARACELGVHISVELVVDAEMRESEPVITDWRDLRVGDVISFTGDDVELKAGEYEVCGTGDAGYHGKYPIQVSTKEFGRPWISNDSWRFIRRP